MYFNISLWYWFITVAAWTCQVCYTFLNLWRKISRKTFLIWALADVFHMSGKGGGPSVKPQTWQKTCPQLLILWHKNPSLSSKHISHSKSPCWKLFEINAALKDPRTAPSAKKDFTYWTGWVVQLIRGYLAWYISGISSVTTVPTTLSSSIYFTFGFIKRTWSSSPRLFDNFSRLFQGSADGPSDRKMTLSADGR